MMTFNFKGPSAIVVKWPVRLTMASSRAPDMMVMGSPRYWVPVIDFTKKNFKFGLVR